MPSLFYAVLLLTLLSRTAMTFLLPGGWQISGYYLDGLFYGLLLTVGVAWLLSIIMLFGRRDFRRALGRTIAIPAILFLGAAVALIPKLFLPSTVSGWPIDSVHSQNRNKFFILAYEPMLTDTAYRVFSAEGSRLNPIWRVELAGTILDYSEDGSLTESPHLLLSKDEQLLVIGRGGHLTDAILTDSQQPLTQSVPWTDKDREQQWQRRTDIIRGLLAAHAGPAAQSIVELTDPEVKTRLDAWCKRIGPDLTKALYDEGWQASCTIEEIESAERGRRQVWFIVTCKKGDAQQDFVRHMSLIQDGGRLLITEQDSGLLWSSNDEQALCERVRSALLELAASGTYLSPLD